jgi:MFS family permease
VGPFYLSRSLLLNTALVGIVMSIGPLVVALTGVPVGRIVDVLGAFRVTILGLVGITVGSILLLYFPQISASLAMSSLLSLLLSVTQCSRRQTTPQL